jgi:hypothetical protein
MEAEIASAVAQFGAAGLIGWMWLSERRAAGVRERQLSESHDRLVQERVALDVLVRVVGENTKALAALDAGQTRLANVLDALAVAARAGAHVRPAGSA